MGHKKILFQLEPDEEGWPPTTVESVWAEERDDGLYVIDNIPFFTPLVAYGDVVEAEVVDGELRYHTTHEHSGHSLIRVVMFDSRDPGPLHAELQSLGCSTEGFPQYSLVAIDIPPDADLDAVQAFIHDGYDQGHWDYEEPILWE